MSVEAVDRKKKLLPWEPRDALFGYALESGNEGDTIRVKEAYPSQKLYHKYYSRNCMN
jgi:hypothetical protein